MDTLPSGVVRVASPAEGAWKAGEEWRLVEELRIGSAEAEGPQMFGEVAALEVDRLGRIWVLERQAKEVRVFGADGRHVRSFGREGGGPGEFSDPIGFAWHPDGTLWVPDPANARYSVHDTTGALVTSHRRPLGGHGMPWAGGFDARGRMHEVAFSFRGGAPSPLLVRFDPQLTAADTVPLADHRGEAFSLRTKTGSMSAAVPFTPRLVRYVSPARGIWSGGVDGYRVAHRTLEGDTTRVVEREYVPVPVTAAEKDEAVEGLKWVRSQGGRIDPSRIPSSKPAFVRMTVDDAGYLWVQPSTTPEMEGKTFDVFDPEGRYLGAARADVAIAGNPPVLIRGDRVYAVARDELDVPYVVRYRVQGRSAAP